MFFDNLRRRALLNVRDIHLHDSLLTRRNHCQKYALFYKNILIREYHNELRLDNVLFLPNGSILRLLPMFFFTLGTCFKTGVHFYRNSPPCHVFSESSAIT